MTSETAAAKDRVLMLGSQDPRVARTRSAILGACERLIERGEALNVQSIAAESGLSRSAFYRHFGGMDDLFAALLEQVFVDAAERDLGLRIGSELGPREAARQSIASLVGIIDSRHQFFGSILAEPANTVRGHLTAVLAERVVYVGLASGEIPEGVDARVVGPFVAGGFVSIVSAWLAGDLELTADELVSQLYHVLPGWFFAADR